MNIARHAEANNVFINIGTNHHQFKMTVEDDGVGFNTSLALENLQTGRGLGVLGMQERATQVGGVLKICSTPGEGTVVQCTIPLAGEV